MDSLSCLIVTINVPRVMFSRVEDHVCAKNLPKGAFLLIFLRRGKMRQIEEKASERGGSVHVSGSERGLF